MGQLRSAGRLAGRDYDRIEAGDELRVDGLTGTLGSDAEFTVHNQAKDQDYRVRHRLSPRQVAMVLAGGRYR